MSSLASAHKAINLGQGFPDFDMDEALVDLVSKAMREGHNQYVHMAGFLPLREAIAAKVEKLYGTLLNPDSEITITPGGTYAIYNAITAVVRPGDEVIVFEPAYDSYIPNIEINGGVVVRIPLQLPDYSIPWQQVANAINARTRLIVLNSPHNPTGAVLGEEDMQMLQSLVRDTRIILLSDEVYEHLIFDGKVHQSMLRYQELFERSFIAFSFGKVFHCTGWKLGYCIAPAAYMAEFRKVHQFNAFTCNSPLQVALSQFLQNDSAYMQLGSELQQRRDYFRHLMSNTLFTSIPSYGSYFELYDYSKMSDEPEEAMAVRLVKEKGVATIPVSAFYRDALNHKTLRFCFAKRRETLEAAAERLVRL
jgi:methionine aminotransferase